MCGLPLQRWGEAESLSASACGSSSAVTSAVSLQARAPRVPLARPQHQCLPPTVTTPSVCDRLEKMVE